jgi:hypothetical protein
MSAITRAPGGKQAGFVPGGAHDEGGGPGVPGVEDAPQRQVGEQARVRLIHDEGGGEALDGAVQSGDRDVGRGERPVGQRGGHLFGRRLAAALQGRAERENRGHVERLQGVGEHDPEGEGLGPARREADEAPVGVGERIEKGRALDGLGPGVGVGEE